MKRVLQILLAAAVLASLLHVAPALLDRLRGPGKEAAPPRLVDLCADRRPDGSLPAACAGDGDVTLLFGGDTALADAALPVLAARGIDFPFASTRELLQGSDLAVLNLEAPITAAGVPFRWGKQYLYRAPPEAASALAAAGLDVAGLANNHADDYGAGGIADTLGQLARAGVLPLGAGIDERSARQGAVVLVGNVRVGLLARCERKLDWDLWVRQYASADHAGVAVLDERALQRDVGALRLRADLIVLLVHWGEGYAPVTGGQRRWARLAAAAGVDLVIGHHPHVPQPIALVARPDGGRIPVAFSLGNYAFGTAGRPELAVGLLLRAHVRDRRLTRLELLPLDVQNRRVGYRPEPLHGSAAALALAPLLAGSHDKGDKGDESASLRLEGDAAILELPRPPVTGP